jgi:hypothetical protein
MAHQYKEENHHQITCLQAIATRAVRFSGDAKSRIMSVTRIVLCILLGRNETSVDFPLLCVPALQKFFEG